MLLAVAITQGGFTTHSMNMGQRYMQLSNTYAFNKDGSIPLHISQPPPNPNLFQSGPALLRVVTNGIPRNGTLLIVSNGQFSGQPTLPVSPLPNSIQLNSASGTAPQSGTGSTQSRLHTVEIIAAIVGAISVIGVAGGVFGMYIARRRKAAAMHMAPGA